MIEKHYSKKRLRNHLWRLQNFFLHQKNKQSHGYAYLLFAIAAERLERIINCLDARTGRYHAPVMALPCADFNIRPEYKPIYAPQQISTESLGDRIANASSYTQNRFVSFKQLALTAEAGCAAYQKPILMPHHGGFAASSGEMISGIWAESWHDDNFLAAQRLTVEDMRNAKNLKGVFASLLGPWTQNYYHWLLQYLPRLGLIAKYCKLSHIDGFLVPSPLAPFHLESLSYFGISPNNVIAVDNAVCPDECIITSIPCENRFVPSWVTEFLRSKIPHRLGISSEKIFVMRGGSSRRQIINKSEVKKILDRHRLKCIDPGSLSFADQVELFSRSRLVCGVHGAALANLVFCPEGSSVIELIPSNYPYPCFQRLSSSFSLSYYALFGLEPKTRLIRSMLPDADVLVDKHRLDLLLEELIPQI